MSLSAGNFIQGFGTPSVGSFNATSGLATLPSATTAGNTIMLVVGSSGGLDVAVSGFTRVTGVDPSGSRRGGIFVKATAGGETSWTITVSSAQPTVWAAYEVENIDVDNPVDVTTAWSSGGPASIANTATSPISTTYDGVAVGVFFGANLSGTTVPVWSSYADKPGTVNTTGYTVLSESSRVEASTAFNMAVVFKPTQQLGQYGVQANLSPSSNFGVGLVMLTATGAKRASRIDAMCGFEIGTVAGITNGAAAGYAPFDAIAGTPAIVSGGRSGSYCAELSASAATEYLEWTTAGSLGFYAPAAPPVLVDRFSVLFPGSLPAADTELFSFGTSAVAGACVLRYRSSGTKLGMKVSATGTEQFTGAVVADVWYNVDVRFSVATSTWTADWRVDDLDQAQASLTGQAVTTLTRARFGWATAATATVRYDDLAVSKVPGHYPLGDLRIYPLMVDPAGTLAVYALGSPDPTSEVNFNTFTANGGSLAPWNATTAKNAIDDIPPTIGASADGLCQITPASAWVRIPMQTYNGGTTEVPRAVKWYWCGWAASAQANNIAFGMSTLIGGVTYALTAFLAADPNFDNSTTAPGWVCRMHRGGLAGEPDDAMIWTQEMLDNLYCEVGGSSDATPDVGIHAVLAEVAMRAVDAPQPLFGDLAAASSDPDSGGIVGVSLTAPTGYDTDLVVQEAGTPTTTTVTGGTTATAVVQAPDAPSTDYIAAYPAAEPTPPA